MHLRRVLVPLVLLIATSMAACGGDDSGDDSGSGIGSSSPGSPTTQGAGDGADAGQVAACDLLTTDEVEAAVGSPVKEGIENFGVPVTGGQFTSCLWQSDDPENAADQAQLYLYSNTAAADSAREDDSQDVPGIGDKAFTVTFAGVWVYQGEQSFLAQWYALSGSDEDNLPKSEALAEAAAAKLG